MKVTYVDHMGNDLSVVNAARVSFNRMSQGIELSNNDFALNTADSKLITFLAEHGHWSPFAHTAITLRVKAPIFVARQLAKHQVGLAWNEISRRYVDYEPELYWPSKWRKRADNLKQGSSDDEFKHPWLFGEVESTCHEAFFLYTRAIAAGLCPEQARMFLPQNTYTEWIWTGSLYAFARVVKLRSDKTAQAETREIADSISKICKQLFPYSWEALQGAKDER